MHALSVVAPFELESLLVAVDRSAAARCYLINGDQRLSGAVNSGTV